MLVLILPSRQNIRDQYSENSFTRCFQTINDLKSGRVTIDQLISKTPEGKSSEPNFIRNPEILIQILEKMKEAAAGSGDEENSKEIDSVIKSYKEGEIDFEKLYFVYSILNDKLNLDLSKDAQE